MTERITHSAPAARPLFSVAVPAYNAQTFLDACIDSVLAQTCDDYELLVIDDGSTDDTPQILRRYADAYPVVRIVRQENMGLLAARRTALANLTGRYVVFLDSDDALRSDALEVLAREIARTRADVVAFGYSNEVDFSRPRFCGDLPFGLFEDGHYKCALRATLSGHFNNLWGKAISLEAFDADVDYSSYFGLMHGEDLLQLLPVMDRARSCLHVEEALYFYRRHSGASTMTFKPSQIDDIGPVLSRLLEYGGRWGMPREARACAAMHICGIAQLISRFGTRDGSDRAEFVRLRDVYVGLGLEDLDRSLQGASQRMMCAAIESGSLKRARAVTFAVDCAKRLAHRSI